MIDNYDVKLHTLKNVIAEAATEVRGVKRSWTNAPSFPFDAVGWKTEKVEFLTDILSTSDALFVLEEALKVCDN